MDPTIASFGPAVTVGLSSLSAAVEFDGPAGAKTAASSGIALRGGLERPVEGDSSLTDPGAFNLQIGRSSISKALGAQQARCGAA